MKKKIVVVDDEVMVLDLFAKTFDKENYEVVTFSDPKQSLEYISKNGTDLVISDIVMPGINGMKLFYAIKKIDPFVQLIFITAYPSLQDITAMLEAGASDFIIKPFDFDNLKKIISETFSRIERWKDLRKIWLKRKR